MNNTEQKKYNKLITAVSIIIPIAVALLFGIRLPNVEPLSFLPPIYASINGLTALILIVSLVAIKNKKVSLHRELNKIAILFSLLFLVMYVAYHMTSDPTEYQGNYPILYYFILVTHIILSISVIPLVLFTFVRGIQNDIARHRKIAKITFPIWLYVAITGVVVYFMISPFYV
jgi:putative membrane protein